MNIGFWWGPEGKRPAGRTRNRWKANIKMDIQKVGWRSVEWIALAQDRDRRRVLVIGAMYIWVLKYVENFLTS